MVAVPMHRHALTYEDLETLPQDGLRYELVDGSLLVTPAPSVRHQNCVARLLVALVAAAPPDVQVLPAPLDWKVSEGTCFQPDVLVARRADVGPDRLERAPLLCIEVLSPSTRLVDLELKRAAYAREGVPDYWVVDPDVPSVVALHLGEGRYGEAATATGDVALRAHSPFPVVVVPADLLR